MRTARVRMIDVAKEAGVSRTTASFVLNGRDASIPEETRLRVRNTAARMGYQPNAAALALATGRTGRIGIILNQPESFIEGDNYFAQIMRGIATAAPEHNVNLLLHSARYKDWQALRDDVLSGGSDGTLLVGRYSNDPLTPALLDAGVPCVCISYQVEHPQGCAVDCDNVDGARQAIQYLLALGHRHIAFLYPGEESSWGRERLLGAQEALSAAGLPPSALSTYAWREATRPSQDWVVSARDFLLALHPRPTAVVCCDEIRARRLAELLPESGVRIPQDMAFISFNSTELSARARPAITSVRQPMEAIGSAAVAMLADIIAQRPLPQRILRFPMALDVRASTGPPSPESTFTQAVVPHGALPNPNQENFDGCSSAA